MYTKVLNSIAVFATALTLVAPMGAMAAKPAPVSTDIAPAPVEANVTVNALDASAPLNLVPLPSTSKKDKGTVSATADPYVAILWVFTDPTTGDWCSGCLSSQLPTFGRHAWIGIQNLSTNPNTIKVGWFSGIAPGTMVTVGSYSGLTTHEHNGLYYDFEERTVYVNANKLNGRIAIGTMLTATQLATINSYILRSDDWWSNSNCSTFASGAWNQIAGGQYTLYAGSPNTPVGLALNMKAKFANYIRYGQAMPWFYAVYYANKTYAPTKSAYNDPSFTP